MMVSIFIMLCGASPSSLGFSFQGPKTVSGLGYLGFWPFTGFKGIVWGTEKVYKGSILTGREHSQSHEGRHMFSGDTILSQSRVSFLALKQRSFLQDEHKLMQFRHPKTDTTQGSQVLPFHKLIGK